MKRSEIFRIVVQGKPGGFEDIRVGKLTDAALGKESVDKIEGVPHDEGDGVVVHLHNGVTRFIPECRIYYWESRDVESE